MTGPDEGAALRTKAARGGLWIALGSLVSKGGLSLVLLVLAAVLSPSELGVLAIGTLVVNLAVQVQDLGLSDALIYRKDDAKEAARTALTLALLAGFVVTGTIVACAPLIADFFSEPTATDVVRGLAVTLVLTGAALVPVSLLTRELAFARRSIPQTIPGLIAGALTVMLALQGHGVASLVVGQVVGAVATVVLAFLVAPGVRPGFDRRIAREMLGYSLPLLGAGLATLGQLNIDYVLVGRLLSTAALGIYSLAYRLAFLPYLAVVQVVNGAAYPLYCRLDDPREKVQALRRVLDVVLLACAPLSAGLVLFAPSVTLLGDKWDPAVPVLRGLAVYTLLYACSQTVGVALKAAGRPGLLLVGSVVHLILLTVALLIAIPAGGLVAVGVAQAVVALAVLVLYLAWLRRELPLRLRTLAGSLLPPGAGVAAMALVALPSAHLPGLTDQGAFLPVTVRALVAVAAYAVVVLLVDRSAIVRLKQVLTGGG